MAKVTGSYASVTRGVSEQVPQDRHPGQHFEQVNMVSDPVRGLVRRHGSITVDERVVEGLPEALSATDQEYIRNYREYSFTINGVDYSLVYQTGERPDENRLPFCFVLNKATGKFLEVFYPDAMIRQWVMGGVSAITTVGKYVIMAGNRVGRLYVTEDQYKAHGGRWVATIRGGAYGRTYRITAIRASDGQRVEASYTTELAAYTKALDLSNIPVNTPDGKPNPDYQRLVNVATSQYNAEVATHTQIAADSISPLHIAGMLMGELSRAGICDFWKDGSIGGDGVRAISVDDGGDGTMMHVALDEVDDLAKLTPVHFPGKVVRVRPKGAAEPYYMQAVSGKPEDNRYQPVVWKEAAAQVVTPQQVFAIGALTQDGRQFVLASTPESLRPVIGDDVPGFAPSRCGDLQATGALPYFLGKQITLLTVFMDRLVIVSNGTVFMSRTGDYFNFFRKSMLTVADDDPIEMYALGAEDDVISRCVTYNKDLFLFGKSKQYTISGRTMLTPKTAAISVAANDHSSVYAQPVVVGNLIYYGKYEEARNQGGPSPYAGRVNQFQLGLFQDTPETHCVSQQLSRYLRGRPIELLALSAPTCLLVRTDGYDNGVYVYSFIDQPGTQSRVFDSWSRWEWHEKVGTIIGMTVYEGSPYVFMLRSDGARTWVACEKFTMDSDLSVNPYLDAQRPGAAYAAGGGFLTPGNIASIPGASIALANTGPRAWLGASVDKAADFWGRLPASEQGAAWAGITYPSYVTLTPPFVRDRNDRAITSGRLVVTHYILSTTDTGGLDGWLDAYGENKRVLHFNGRQVGARNNQVGRQPVTTTSLCVPVGRANLEHKVSLHAHAWLPLGLTSIEWAGQLFMNARRV